MYPVCYGHKTQEFLAIDTGFERMALAHVLQITVFLQRSSTDPEHVAASSAASRNIDLLQMCSDYEQRQQ
jgi:hypothetical protein